MKKNCLLLLCFLFLLGACDQKEKQLTEEPLDSSTENPVENQGLEENPEAAADSLEKADSLSSMLDDITGSIDINDPSIWYSHNNNRSIVYENGYTYRIFSDGIYRRAAGSEDWELLFYGEMSRNRGLQLYKEFLYFTLNREGEDPDANFVRQTLWQLNLNTREARQIGDMVEDIPYIVAIYDGNLYIGYSLFSSLRYDVYPLNEQGMPGEKLDEASPDFICAKQNAYSLEEEANWTHMDGRSSSYSPEMLKMEREVIPIPFCASMLHGYYITTNYYTESLAHFYLTKATIGEQEFLFDAYDILAVTSTGIYCIGDESSMDQLFYYSFSQKKALPLLYPEISYETFHLLTYDRAWLYYYLYPDDNIMRMSRSTGTTEVFLDAVPANLNLRYYAVDPEYFYLDDQMYPL